MKKCDVWHPRSEWTRGTPFLVDRFWVFRVPPFLCLRFWGVQSRRIRNDKETHCSWQWECIWNVRHRSAQSDCISHHVSKNVVNSDCISHHVSKTHMSTKYESTTVVCGLRQWCMMLETGRTLCVTQVAAKISGAVLLSFQLALAWRPTMFETIWSFACTWFGYYVCVMRIYGTYVHGFCKVCVCVC